MSTSVPLPAAEHHGSHGGLVALEDSDQRTPLSLVDAIVVPTGRHVASLHMAIGLASAIDCTLVLLCSRWSNHQKAARLASSAGVDVVAINATTLPVGLMPTFETTKLLAGEKFDRRTDTSLKRNLGLLLARLAGWERVVFLDDDICVPEPVDLAAAAGLIGEYDGVGLAIGGFPDNSVVCHAYRETGGFQDTFVGGGALAVGSTMFGSFFPNIYNEDWFFLLDEQGLRRTAVTGRAVQKPYDPFANESRARSEEFGDCLAEGVFTLLDQGCGVEDADIPFWRKFLANRLELITNTIAKVNDLQRDPAEKRRMESALKAARGRCQLITPQLCVDYVHAWLRDRLVWQKHLDDWAGRDRAGRRDMATVIKATGLADRSHLVPKVWEHQQQAGQPLPL